MDHGFFGAFCFFFVLFPFLRSYGGCLRLFWSPPMGSSPFSEYAQMDRKKQKGAKKTLLKKIDGTKGCRRDREYDFLSKGPFISIRFNLTNA